MGTAIAVLAARLLDRSLAIGFYLAGAALLAVAFLSSAAASENAHPHGHTVAGGAEGKELLVRRSLSYALVGFVLAGVGVLLEAV